MVKSRLMVKDFSGSPGSPKVREGESGKLQRDSPYMYAKIRMSKGGILLGNKYFQGKNHRFIGNSDLK